MLCYLLPKLWKQHDARQLETNQFKNPNSFCRGIMSRSHLAFNTTFKKVVNEKASTKQFFWSFDKNSDDVNLCRGNSVPLYRTITSLKLWHQVRNKLQAKKKIHWYIPIPWQDPLGIFYAISTEQFTNLLLSSHRYFYYNTDILCHIKHKLTAHSRGSDDVSNIK